jgi:hypothetical protein
MTCRNLLRYASRISYALRMTKAQETFPATTLKEGDIYYARDLVWHRVAHIARRPDRSVFVTHEDGTTATFYPYTHVVITHDADDPSTPPAVDSEFVGL